MAFIIHFHSRWKKHIEGEMWCCCRIKSCLNHNNLEFSNILVVFSSSTIKPSLVVGLGRHSHRRASLRTAASLLGWCGSCRGIPSVAVVSGGVRGPQGEVVTQQLHDQRRVFVAVLVQRVQLGDSVIECLQQQLKVKLAINNKDVAILSYLLGELTSFFGRVEDLVVEHAEVQGQAEPDGMRGLHLWLGDLEGLLVSLLGVLKNWSAVITGGNLGEVPKKGMKNLSVTSLSAAWSNSCEK